MFFLTVFIILIASFVWLAFSIKIVGPAEMAVKVYFGNPVAFCDSGIRFVPFSFGLTYLKRYSKKIYNLDYKAREVITKAGQEAGIKYGAQKLKVDAVAYISFPKELETSSNDKIHPLIKILKAGVPIDRVQLRDWAEEAIVSALRLAFSQMTWAKAVEDIQAINRKAGEIFKNADSVLVRAGFKEKDINLVVSEIRLPKGVEDSLPQPDKARIEADAAKDKAKYRAIESVGTVVEMMAQSHGMSVEEIQKEIQKDENLRKEFQQYAMDLNIRLSEADRGAFFDFRSPDAKGIDASILSLIALLSRGVSGEKESGEAGSSKGSSGGSGGKKTPLKSEAGEDML